LIVSETVLNFLTGTNITLCKEATICSKRVPTLLTGTSIQSSVGKQQTVVERVPRKVVRKVPRKDWKSYKKGSNTPYRNKYSPL
jgi:hypothetical protein